MRTLQKARAAARAERERLAPGTQSLLDCLREELSRKGIEIVPVSAAFLNDSRGELVPAEGALYYDKRLTNRDAELLEVVAHEYGHLLLHHARFGAEAEDLIKGSAFLGGDSSALSRYSPRSRDEAEASAFAAEFLCPATELFERWRSDPSASADDLTEVVP